MLSILALCASAWPATLTVGPEGDHQAIQAAIDAASPGDRIEVGPGSWVEDLVVETDLSLVGVEGSDLTALVGTEVALTVDGASLIVSGFDVRASGGAGARASGAALSLVDLRLWGARVEGDGGGLLAVDSVVVLDDVEMWDNRVGEHDGGHLHATGSTVTADGCSFTGGRAGGGGALYLVDSDLEARDSTFRDNSVRGGDQAGRGGALRAVGGSLLLEGCAFDSNVAEEGFGGHIAQSGGVLEVADCSFARGEASLYHGGAINAFDAAVSVHGCSFEDNVARYLDGEGYGHGAGIMSYGGGSLVVADTTFVRQVAEGWGAGIYAGASSVRLDGCTFSDSYAWRGAGAYLVSTGESVVERCSFVDNDGRFGAGLRWYPGADTASLVVRTSRFTGNVATRYAGALYAREGGSVVLEDNLFQANGSELGGGLLIWDVDEVRATRNTVCANTSEREDDSVGGGAAVFESGAVAHEWVGNTFVENDADVYGGGLFLVDGDPVLLVNNTFLGNSAGTDGGAVFVDEVPVVFMNNAVAWTLGGDGLVASSAEGVQLSTNAWWENVGTHTGGALGSPGETDLVVDPDLATWTANRDCSDDALWPVVDSALRDAGDPDLVDPDGSRSDIGATGGPQADPALFVDADGDGFAVIYDCDEADGAAYPGAAETPYDGQDQDCDGADLTDVDGDGWDGGGGPDCDDDDPSVHPGAEEVWYDGVDGDCDGADDYDRDGDGAAGGPGGPDCDDEDPTRRPGVDDPPGDGVDADCDGEDGAEPSSARCGCSAGAPGAWPWLTWLYLIRRGPARRRRTC